MADFTKRAIRESFLKLLNEKPLKQISVKDIVDDCGINRNTFYYHYQDIPTLMESIIWENADRIILENPTIHSIEECIEAIIGFSQQNRRAVLHIYKSISRDVFDRYQWHVCDYAVRTFLDEALKDKDISESDRNVLTTYVKCLCFGVVVHWLENDLGDDIYVFVHRLCELKQGDLDRLIENCMKKE